MDALKSFFVWPLYTAKSYVLVSTAWAIAIIPLLIRFLTGGRKCIALFTDTFKFFSKLPLGCHAFSSLIYLTAPYSGSIGSITRYLGREDDTISCVVTMDDYPWLRNPFGSLHAIALSNLGELASGQCMVSAMQHAKGVKGIPVRIETSYHKKARGSISGRASVSLKAIQECVGEYKVTTQLTDQMGNEVATCLVTWSVKNTAKESEKKTD
jgi:acyl-coenzyme A thioesterase PaaI-like protein